MVTYMDRLVGRVTAKLDVLGLRENTLLLFLGDNGTARGVRSRMGERVVVGGKGLTTAAGMHVPLIASWPAGIARAGVVEDLVDSTDFLPTLLDAAGVRPDPGMVLDGRSFLPQLRGRRGSPRPWIYAWYCPRQPANLKAPPREFAFDREYKLYGSGEYYDLAADREEARPLATGSLTGAAAGAAGRLQAALNRFKEVRSPAAPDS
jgi:arylsulfatase A